MFAEFSPDLGAEVNKPRKHFMYPLHLAAQSGDIRIAKLLVENSARIDAANDEQATALHRAAALNHEEVAKFLVDRYRTNDQLEYRYLTKANMSQNCV